MQDMNIRRTRLLPGQSEQSLAKEPWNMMNKSLRDRVYRAMMLICVGGSVFQLGGCDPTVRDALLTGLEDTTLSLVEALISALFLTMQT